MKILVINCGSSSLKYEIYNMPEQQSLGKGLIERIGLDNGRICQTNSGSKYEYSTSIPDYRTAFELMMQAIMDPDHGILISINEIKGIGHRVVHGGDQYSASVVIDHIIIDHY